MEPDLHIDGIDERFLVRGRMEILALLNELIYRQEPVTIRFGAGEGFETRLLEAREHALIFEAGEDAAGNRHLMDSAGCHFLASPDGIQVLFSAGQVQPLCWGESAAFCVSLPERVARLQRQESLRTIVSPQGAPVVRLYAANGQTLGQRRLHDLSAGGLGVAARNAAEIAEAASVARVHVNLPGHGEIDCAVRLRHATELGPDSGDFSCRLGFSFSGLPETMRVAILRYIVDAEQARREALLSRQVED